MTTPSPFEIGRMAGNSLLGPYVQRRQQERDTSAIDEILNQASQSNDPGAVVDAMGQILSRVSPANRKDAMAVLQYKQQQLENSRQRAEQEQASQELGLPKGSQYITPTQGAMYKNREEQARSQQQQQQRQQLLGQDVPPPQDMQNLSKEEQLAQLDAMEQRLLNSGIDPKVTAEDLKSIRSKRNVIAQELAGGEKEAGKQAALRRSKKIESWSEKADAAEATITAVDGLESIVKSGGTGPSARNSLLNATSGKSGILGSVHDFMMSAEKQGFDSAQRAFFPQLKAFFGARITDVDLKTFMSTLAQFGTDPKAQELALATLRQQADFDLNMGRATLDLIDEDGRPVKGFEKKLGAKRSQLEKESRLFFQKKAEELGVVRGQNPPIPTSVGTFNENDLIKEAKRRGLL